MWCEPYLAITLVEAIIFCAQEAYPWVTARFSKDDAMIRAPRDQIERFMTALFCHDSLPDLLCSGLVNICAGYLLRREYKKVKFTTHVLLYLLSGTCGNLFSFCFGMDPPVTLGASPAGYGVLGAVAMARLRRRALDAPSGSGLALGALGAVSIWHWRPHMGAFGTLGGFLSGMVGSFFI